jgi:hypothetical protein
VATWMVFRTGHPFGRRRRDVAGFTRTRLIPSSTWVRSCLRWMANHCLSLTLRRPFTTAACLPLDFTRILRVQWTFGHRPFVFDGYGNVFVFYLDVSIVFITFKSLVVLIGWSTTRNQGDVELGRELGRTLISCESSHSGFGKWLLSSESSFF